MYGKSYILSWQEVGSTQILTCSLALIQWQVFQDLHKCHSIFITWSALLWSFISWMETYWQVLIHVHLFSHDLRWGNFLPHDHSPLFCSHVVEMLNKLVRAFFWEFDLNLADSIKNNAVVLLSLLPPLTAEFSMFLPCFALISPLKCYIA